MRRSRGLSFVTAAVVVAAFLEVFAATAPAAWADGPLADASQTTTQPAGAGGVGGINPPYIIGSPPELYVDDLCQSLTSFNCADYVAYLAAEITLGHLSTYVDEAVQITNSAAQAVADCVNETSQECRTIFAVETQVLAFTFACINEQPGEITTGVTLFFDCGAFLQTAVALTNSMVDLVVQCANGANETCASAFDLARAVLGLATSCAGGALIELGVRIGGAVPSIYYGGSVADDLPGVDCAAVVRLAESEAAAAIAFAESCAAATDPTCAQAFQAVNNAVQTVNDCANETNDNCRTIFIVAAEAVAFTFACVNQQPGELTTPHTVILDCGSIVSSAVALTSSLVDTVARCASGEDPTCAAVENALGDAANTLLSAVGGCLTGDDVNCDLATQTLAGLLATGCGIDCFPEPDGFDGSSWDQPVVESPIDTAAFAAKPLTVDESDSSVLDNLLAVDPDTSATEVNILVPPGGEGATTPIESESHYVTTSRVATASSWGKDARSGNQTVFLHFGAVCSSGGMSYFSGGSCYNFDNAVTATRNFIYGYLNNKTAHSGPAVVYVIMTTNNSGTTNSTTQQAFAKALYAGVKRAQAYAQAATTAAAQSGRSLHFYVDAGDDIEDGSGFNDVAGTLPLVKAFSDYSSAQSPRFRMVLDSGYTGTCGSATCWNTKYNRNYTPHIWYNLNYGYAASWPFPQNYNYKIGYKWAALNRAAAAAGKATMRFEGVMGDCEYTETSPQDAYWDFAYATGQKPPYLTDMHALGSDASTC